MSIETHNKRTAALVLMFGSKMQDFVRELDYAFHKNPTTTDWVAVATSIALIFDMFQYIFYLLQVGLSQHLKPDDSLAYHLPGDRRGFWSSASATSDNFVPSCSRASQYGVG